MKIRFAIYLSVIVLSAAPAQTTKAAAKPAPAKATATAKAIEIPAGAVAAEPGSFHYTDAQGKKWIYRKTPFGIARIEEPTSTDDAASKRVAAEPAAGHDRYDNVSAIEDGDTIRFERGTPFGMQKWQRKKSELTETEQAMWNQERAKIAARQD
jgi:hypothetical protein